MSVNKKMKECKVCGKEIAKNAKECPGCGAKIKSPFYKKWWIIAAVIIVVVAAVSGAGDDGKNVDSVSVQTENVAGNETDSTEANTEKEYIVCDASVMVSDLENNPLNAENKYNDKYVEVKGKLSNIDSDGSYINIQPSNNEFNLVNIQCFTQNDEQIQTIAALSMGDTVTVKGKVTNVGELMGYTMDIEEIILT